MTFPSDKPKSKNRQGLFMRKASRNKVRLSLDLGDLIPDRVLITRRDGRYRLTARGPGGGSRAVHRLGRYGYAVTHADLWKSMPDSRVYLAEVEPGIWEALP